MNIVEEIANKYRSAKGYGVQFSIIDDDDTYSYDGPIDVEFGKSTSGIAGGQLENYQPIFLNGKADGFLWESQNGRLFDPMVISFCLPIADCQDDDFDEIYNKLEHDPHFYDEGESIMLRFATLQQYIDFVTETVDCDTVGELIEHLNTKNYAQV